ncbi:Peroxidase [Handroanthus impetiginosus]|uniref:Peroxidase n=1 Tax=Handroanthus impetiginosus TaxID=429701 RepID=A0A2G9H4V6_9LAMI|nr:Peroxidase [Handroanthus impetiginosus]
MKIAGLISFVLILVTAAFAQPLCPDYYDKTCPQALSTIKRVVDDAVQQEKRMGASLLRLHFHDCFVNGCDGSNLLDSTPEFESEKMAAPNRNSARGFEVIDRIKSEVDHACGRPVVSCSDILAVAARDSVVALGGPYWDVLLGRRDATSASKSAADSDIPAPTLDLSGLIKSFQNQGLDVHDLVALSGGHTIGFAQCRLFRDHIYNDSNIDPEFRRELQAICPRNGDDTNLHSLDPTPAFFDTKYFGNVLVQRGLLHSDQALLESPETRGTVAAYSLNLDAFAKDFVISIVKMGNIKPLTGDQGQIRYNCRKVN